MSWVRRDRFRGHATILAEAREKRPNEFSSETGNPAPCPFCPGHESQTPSAVAARPEGPDWQVRVFSNKYPALTLESPPDSVDVLEFPGYGSQEVIVESPDHAKDLPDLTEAHAALVFSVILDRLDALARIPRAKHVTYFKNYGRLAGATRAHPHGQLASLPFVPPGYGRELEAAREEGQCPVCWELEASEARRTLSEEGGFRAFTPYAPRVPWEVWIAPAGHEPSFLDLGDQGTAALGAAVRGVLTLTRRVLGTHDYNLVLQVPVVRDEQSARFIHWRLEVQPRTSFLAGFESGTGVLVSPVSPEATAAALREAGS